MKYSRFELLTLAVGGMAIVGTIIASFRGQPMVEEIAAQVLLMVVLFGAVHWGRNGGSITAVFATVAYVGMRAPMFLHDGLTTDLLALVMLHMVTFGFIGIVGGEVCGRIKYVFADLEAGINIDFETRLYNEGFVGRLLESNLGMYTRYRTPFSVVRITLASGLTSELKPARRRSLLRTVSGHIRNDVRLVDDVGRMEDGSFMLILPSTPKSGAEVAAARVREGLRTLLGAREESVTATVLGVPEDLSQMEALRDGITGVAAIAAPEPPQGVAV